MNRVISLISKEKEAERMYGLKFKKRKQKPYDEYLSKEKKDKRINKKKNFKFKKE